MRDDPPFSPAVMYNGPPPGPPLTDGTPIAPPPITILAPKIISSKDKLFFIAHKLGNSSNCEWRLVRVAFTASISLYPSALQDGRFLVEFYVAHPQDIRCNVVNQRYWLQYCVQNGISDGRVDAHLITPSDTSEDRAAKHHLHPVRCWVNLTHADTYIHGPFELPPFEGEKPGTASIRSVGMHWPLNHRCFPTRYQVSPSPRIPSTWTVAFIRYFQG